jgi:hypothetical protein
MSRLLLCLLVAVLPGAELPQWRATTITDSLKMGYQLIVADLNRDGRLGSYCHAPLPREAVIMYGFGIVFLGPACCAVNKTADWLEQE